MHASVHTATHSVHTASAGPRVSPSAPHHPLLIHASPPPPLQAPAPLLLFPLCAGVAAPPSARRSWPSLPSSRHTAAAVAAHPSTRQQPAPAPLLLLPRAGAVPPSARQKPARCSSANRRRRLSVRRRCPSLPLSVRQQPPPLLLHALAPTVVPLFARQRRCWPAPGPSTRRPATPMWDKGWHEGYFGQFM